MYDPPDCPNCHFASHGHQPCVGTGNAAVSGPTDFLCSFTTEREKYFGEGVREHCPLPAFPRGCQRRLAGAEVQQGRDLAERYDAVLSVTNMGCLTVHTF